MTDYPFISWDLPLKDSRMLGYCWYNRKTENFWCIYINFALLMYGEKEIISHRQMAFSALNLSMKNNVPKVTLPLHGANSYQKVWYRQTIPVWKPQEYPLLVFSYWHCAPQSTQKVWYFLWLCMESKLKQVKMKWWSIYLLNNSKTMFKLSVLCGTIKSKGCILIEM